MRFKVDICSWFKVSFVMSGFGRFHLTGNDELRLSLGLTVKRCLLSLSSMSTAALENTTIDMAVTSSLSDMWSV